VLNKVLNETVGGVPQEGSLVSAAMGASTPSVMDHVDKVPQPIANALTKNYSSLLKAVEKKKNINIFTVKRKEDIPEDIPLFLEKYSPATSSQVEFNRERKLLLNPKNMRDIWMTYVKISVNWIVSQAESLNYQGWIFMSRH
jgi:hypothetical protein